MSDKSPRMICIDDDPLALDQLRFALDEIRLPIRCDFFGSPAKALSAHRCDPADLVLSDLRLGATTGLKLIAEMRHYSPDSVYMLISGQADLESALAAMNYGDVYRFFTKPAEKENLGARLCDAITELNARRLRSVSLTTLGAVERLTIGVAALTLDGDLIFANGAAKAIFEKSGCFDMRAGGGVRSVNPDENRQFQDFLRRSALNQGDASERSTFRFAASDKPTPVIFSLSYSPSGGPQNQPFFNVLVLDPARRSMPETAEIAAALNLTPSEARIVQGLAEGDNMEEAAKRAGVSLSTARSYLKTVFSKTGVSRQAELVRLTLLACA
ncbi:MAG: DNA-binding response regulator [Oricola sp.]|nr:DNA-binding response regulator [Oricola sp.]